MGFSSDLPLQSNQSSVSLEIPSVDNPAFKETLSLYLKRSTDSINTKEGAIYNLTEQANFQQWFPTSTSGNNSSSLVFRNGYRKVFNLSVTGLIFNHGITGIVQVTDYWGMWNSATDFRKIPYPGLTTETIAANVTFTQVVIVAGAGTPAFTGGFFVLEYLKN